MNCFKYLPVALLFAAGVSTAPAQTVEESLAEGRAAFMSYDFKGAARHYATARKSEKENPRRAGRAGKGTDEGGEFP